MHLSIDLILKESILHVSRLLGDVKHSAGHRDSWKICSRYFSTPKPRCWCRSTLWFIFSMFLIFFFCLFHMLRNLEGQFSSPEGYLVAIVQQVACRRAAGWRQSLCCQCFPGLSCEGSASSEGSLPAQRGCCRCPWNKTGWRAHAVCLLASLLVSDRSWISGRWLISPSFSPSKCPS